MAVSITIWTLSRSKSSYLEEEKSSPPSTSCSSTTPPGENRRSSTQLIRCSSSWNAINIISKQQVTSFHRHRSPSSTPSAASQQAWDSQPDDSSMKNHVDKIAFCLIFPFLFLFVRSAKLIDLFCLCEYVDQLLCVFAVLLSKEGVGGASVAFATSSTDSDGKQIYWLKI